LDRRAWHIAGPAIRLVDAELGGDAELISLAMLSARIAAIDFDAVQRKALEDASQRIEKAVRESLTPPDGSRQAPRICEDELRDSIAHEIDTARAVIGSTSRVAPDQELGSRRNPPRPFLAPAAAALGESVAEAIGTALADAIRMAARTSRGR